MSETEPSRHHSVLSEDQLAPPLPGAMHLAYTRWLMLLEQNLRLCWKFYCVLGLFLGLALFDLFIYLPGFLHFLVLALFVAACLQTLWGTGAGWRLPSLPLAARRLEAANDLTHYPYEALTAHPVNPRKDSAVKTLWRIHQERARAMLRRLRLPRPEFGIAGHDPHRMRLGVLLLLAGALVLGYDDGGERLRRALTPADHVMPQLGASARITAWVTPPVYTGLAPMLLADQGKVAADKEWAVPVGSKLALRVAEIDEAPVLAADGIAIPFVKAGERNFTLDTVMPETTLLKIRSGWSTLARWSVRMVPDKPPTAAWGEPPHAEKQDGVTLHYRAADDYNLTHLRVVMNLAVSAVGLPSAPQFLPLSGAGQKQIEGKVNLPLGINLWAGMPVTLVVEAADQAGQTGRSGSVAITLPEHRFTDPLAQELAAARKQLLLDHEGQWTPVINLLVALSQDVPRYRGDPRILLGLRSTAVRMYHDGKHDGLTDVATTLWEMALHLDTGGVAQAEEKLRQAQQALEQALSRKADPETVQQKMEALQQALAEYMQSLARNLPPEAQDIPQDLLDEAGQDFARDMLEKIKEIEDLAQTGAHEAAQQKLQELQQMLDQMRQMTPMTEEQKQDMESLKQMRELIEKQEKLQEQTGKAERQPQGQQGQQGQAPGRRQTEKQPAEKPYASPVPREDYAEEPPEDHAPPDDVPANHGAAATQAPGQPSGEQQGAAASTPEKGGEPGAGGTEKREDLSGAGLAQQQQELRQELGKIAGDLAARQSETPPQLGRADQGMKAAQQKLGEEEWPQAKREQGKTLQALKDLAGQMKRQLQQQIMFLPSGGQQGQDGETRNPFSHSDKEGRGAVEGNVKVPDQQEVQKARKILDELRRRSGEYERPREERGYIERLLEKF